MGNTQPTDGSSFLSMECSGGPGGAGEGISVTLCEGTALTAGQQYCFAIDLITRNGGFGAGSSGLVIYGSNSICQTTQTLWTLPQATGSWQTYNFCFTPTGDWTVISFRVLNPNSGFSAIGLDNWRSTDGLFPPQASPSCLTVEAEGGTICPGECTTVSAIAADGTEPYTYTWSGGLPNGPGPHEVCPGQTTTYTVTVTDADGNTATADAVVTVSSQGCIDLVAAGGSICTGDCFDLVASASGGFAPYTYAWSNGVPAGPGPHQVCPGSTTTYTVTVTDATGSTASTTVTVEVAEELCLSVQAEGGTICPSACFALQATASGGTTPYVFTWEPGGFQGPGPHQVCPTTTTAYTVTVSDQSGAQGTRTVLVQVVSGTANAGPDRTIPCTNDPIVLEGSTDVANGSPVWSTVNGSIIANGDTYLPTVNRPGTYVLSVTDPITGCVFQDAAVVVYDGQGIFDAGNVLFPNVVTPNGDGANDSFFPFFRDDPAADLSALVTDFELAIYNRWGQLIYTSDRPSQRWNARTEAGERVSDGVYYFTARLRIICSDGRTDERKGYIHVLN